jgi:hypothetical protein
MQKFDCIHKNKIVNCVVTLLEIIANILFLYLYQNLIFNDI